MLQACAYLYTFLAAVGGLCASLSCLTYPPCFLSVFFFLWSGHTDGSNMTAGNVL